jgi:hypothetical protein
VVLGVPKRIISFSEGGWVILLAIGLTSAIVAWRLIIIATASRADVVGDGRDVATYGFDLSTTLVPTEQIVAGGVPKDGIPAFVAPPTVPGSRVKQINEAKRGKLLVPSDRVIGVSVGDEARAYPIRMLNWHEVANDTLGGREIAVTYSPLCDSVVVFDRRVGDDVLTFGVSGLLYNSNLVMYDRRPDAVGESLWSQLQLRAIAGPAAAVKTRLTAIPASLVQWGDWLERHPDTDVITGDPQLTKRYKRDPYGHYYSSDSLKFPVTPLPPADSMPFKERVVVVGVHNSKSDGNTIRRVFPLSTIATAVDAAGSWTTDIGTTPVRFTYRDHPPTVHVAAIDPGADVEVIYSFWFAWHAMHPDANVR